MRSTQEAFHRRPDHFDDGIVLNDVSAEGHQQQQCLHRKVEPTRCDMRSLNASESADPRDVRIVGEIECDAALDIVAVCEVAEETGDHVEKTDRGDRRRDHSEYAHHALRIAHFVLEWKHLNPLELRRFVDERT